MEATKVKLVQMVDGQMIASETKIENLDAFMSVRGFEPNGKVQPVASPSGIVYREEIQGQPKFDGLAGPSYDGPGVVRYEDWASYERLST